MNFVKIINTVAAVIVLSATPLAGTRADPPGHVMAISAPAAPLPPEAESRGETSFSFVVYGDTRGRHDGTAIQYEHSLVIDAMLLQIKKLAGTATPVRFVLQSGDAVFDGRDANQWNVSFVPLINRLTTEANVPYFLVPGNHEHTTTAEGLRNYLDAVAALIPPEGSPRRLSGRTTFAFGYGNAFIVGLDANIADDERQYEWIRGQLEGLDRARYANVFVFCHQAPFSSGSHGGSRVEPETRVLRDRYLPLFHAHHVRALFSGHEHLFEHWVEHYEDGSGVHRLDLVVSGGGGAPIYGYKGEPSTEAYLAANKSINPTLVHLVRPGLAESPTPYHFLLVTVKGTDLQMQVIGVDWGAGFAPYRSDRTPLQDEARR